MLNNVVLIGRSTKDSDLRYTPSGVGISNFTLAVDRPYNKDKKETDFINIVAFRQLAETCANYVRKGKLYAVVGRIQTRSYENNEGRKIFVVEVVAENVRFLERNETQERTPTEAARNSDPFADDGKLIDIDVDSLPF